MSAKLLLPFWLVFLAAFSSVPAIARAADPTTPTPASGPNLRFDCLSAADGLSFSLTTSILQDQRGFMWFGTRYGFDKYDGNAFTAYLPGSSGDVMGGNYIYDLYQDRNGSFWLITSIDVVRWYATSGTFKHYAVDPPTPDPVVPRRINTIGEDASGTLWVGTNEGLRRYDPASDSFLPVWHEPSVFRIYAGRAGDLWLGTYHGLWHYASGSLEGEKPVKYQHDRANPTSLSNGEIFAIHEDSAGTLWVGTLRGGLDRLDRATGEFTHYLHEPRDPYSLSHSDVYAVQEDARGRFWVGTVDGLDLLDRETGRFFHYSSDPSEPHSLRGNFVFDILTDRSGVTWIATVSGVCKVNETSSQLTVYGEDPQLQGATDVSRPNRFAGFSDSQITTLYVDRDRDLWVGTGRGRLNRLDRSNGMLSVYQGGPTSLGAVITSAVHEDSEGTLWLGTDDGLRRFDPRTEAFAPETSLRGRTITSIAADASGNLWVGDTSGLRRRAAGASVFADVVLPGDGLAGAQIGGLYADGAGALWVAAGSSGLFRIDPPLPDETARDQETTLVHFLQNSTDPRSPGTSPVTSFYEDDNGTLWLGTLDDGLVRFNRDTQTFVHYMPDTAVARYVSCIQADSHGRLWLGTMKGVARFDPASETFAYYDARDGLTVGESMACARSGEGEMFFGGWSGLVSFFPDRIMDNATPPPVVITALNLNNVLYRSDLVPGEQVSLAYFQNRLSFDFVALDYTVPAKNQYAYKLEGLDADWVQAGTRRHADYPDLRPGTYTFRVLASNNSGIWNEQGAAVRIYVAPPFWQTWWFLGLACIVVAGAAGGGYRWRTRRMAARSRDLERQIGERTSALEQKTLELQQRTIEIERRRQELEALLSADDRMQRYLHQDQVLQALVDVAVDNMRADKSCVIWWDENREKLVMRVTRGFDPKATKEVYFTPGEGIVGRVAATREPESVEDSLTDPRRLKEAPANVKFALDEGIRSFVFFPIIVGDDVVGVFNVCYAQPYAAGEEEQRLFQALTQRAALQIENARLYERSQELAVLEERSRLARELHDAVTQMLFSASLVAEALPSTWERDAQEGRSLVQELRGLCRGALAEMRTLLLELRPARLAETPLDDLVRQLGEAAAGREGIPLVVQVEGQAATCLPQLPPEVRMALYRIAQEALNNVVKHARAHHVTVRLSCHAGDRGGEAPGSAEPLSQPRLSVLLSVRDDGRGFDAVQVPHNRLGLGIMQERAAAIGAHLTIESQPGQGTQVAVLWEQN